VITRLWRGWTATGNADAYERFLLQELFPSMRCIRGFTGADVLRRDVDGDEVAFVTLTRFESLDAIRGFAGENYETSVIEPQAAALLSHYDDRAQHFSTAAFKL
jgi:antibiotic biosynthesis monooxygenase (ABM) superfamily enzyme